MGETRAPHWAVADIVRLYGDADRARRPVPPSHHKGMPAILVCRTAARGGHAARCVPGGCARYADHSCRTRHCPTCQPLPKAPWLEDRQAARVPVPSVHPVFPLPHARHPRLLGHQRLRLTMLCKAASQTLRQGGQPTRGGQVGRPRVLPTWE